MTGHVCARGMGCAAYNPDGEVRPMQQTHRPVKRMIGRKLYTTCLVDGVTWPCPDAPAEPTPAPLTPDHIAAIRKHWSGTIPGDGMFASAQKVIFQLADAHDTLALDLRNAIRERDHAHRESAALTTALAEARAEVAEAEFCTGCNGGEWTWQRRAEQAEAELAATIKAKQENDERFQLEAGEQRQRAERAESERDEARAGLAAAWREGCFARDAQGDDAEDLPPNPYEPAPSAAPAATGQPMCRTCGVRHPEPCKRAQQHTGRGKARSGSPCAICGDPTNHDGTGRIRRPRAEIDPTAGAAYVHLTAHPITRTVALGDWINVDLAADGTAVGVEILTAIPAEPHPCGHAVMVRHCGGCDPGAGFEIRDGITQLISPGADTKEIP